jgi:hypothetical protein
LFSSTFLLLGKFSSVQIEYSFLNGNGREGRGEGVGVKVRRMGVLIEGEER